MTLAPEAVIVGLGQVGSVLSRAFEARGTRVVPVRRGDSIDDVARAHPHPVVVAVAVAEADLDAALAALPTTYRSHTLLVQNELRAGTLVTHRLVDPTTAVVWFETKKDRPLRVILSTPVAGPFAPELVLALAAIGVDAHEVPRANLPFELAAKNAYILGTNLAGLRVGGVVRSLVEEHASLFDRVLDELLAIEDRLSDVPLDHEAIRAKVRDAIAADPDHVCTGRSAPARLARTLAHADALGLAVPTLRSLASDVGP